MKQVLRIAKLSSNAKIPTKGSKLAAGYDLYSAYDYVVPPKGKILAMTDIQVQVPSGHYGRVAPRSGLAVKNFIDVGAGVVDEDYRGNLGVVLFNFGSEEFKVNKGDRVAQFICEKISYPELEEVEACFLRLSCGRIAVTLSQGMASTSARRFSSNNNNFWRNNNGSAELFLFATNYFQIFWDR